MEKKTTSDFLNQILKYKLLIGSGVILIILVLIFSNSSNPTQVYDLNVTANNTTDNHTEKIEADGTEITEVAKNTDSVQTTEIKNTEPPVIYVAGTRTKTSGCLSNQVLPDSACTPGAILSTSTAVICVVGYTKTVRNVPDSLRQEVFREYGIDYSLHSNYEVDHLISLELGGSNDIANLFPESYSIENGARVKDKFENYLHDQMCSGKISAQEAQRQIATNWLKYYQLAYNIQATTSQPTTTNTTTVSSNQVTSTQPTTQTQAQTQTGTKYYTSSYGSSKYYYPEVCNEWKSLSTKYLKSFDNLSALLATYPSRTLSPQCQ